MQTFLTMQEPQVPRLITEYIIAVIPAPLPAPHHVLLDEESVSQKC